MTAVQRRKQLQNIDLLSLCIFIMKLYWAYQQYQNMKKLQIFAIFFLIVLSSCEEDKGLQRCIKYCLVDAPNPDGEEAPQQDAQQQDSEDNTPQDTIYDQQYQQCRQECKEKRESYRKISIALISAVLGICALFCISALVCFVCKQKYSKWSERNKRKPVPNNITPDEFASYAEEFKNVFTEGQRDMWDFIFYANGLPQAMQWFSLQMKNLSDFEYEIQMKGQDVYGVWDANGYYVNTEQGPTAWWFKNYEQASKQSKSMCVYELVRSHMGTYTGVWYLKGATGVQQVVNLQRRFENNRDNVQQDEIGFDIESGGGSEQVL